MSVVKIVPDDFVKHKNLKQSRVLGLAAHAQSPV